MIQTNLFNAHNLVLLAACHTNVRSRTVYTLTTEYSFSPVQFGLSSRTPMTIATSDDDNRTKQIDSLIHRFEDGYMTCMCVCVCGACDARLHSLRMSHNPFLWKKKKNVFRSLELPLCQLKPFLSFPLKSTKKRSKSLIRIIEVSISVFFPSSFTIVVFSSFYFFAFLAIFSLLFYKILIRYLLFCFISPYFFFLPRTALLSHICFTLFFYAISPYRLRFVLFRSCLVIDSC